MLFCLDGSLAATEQLLSIDTPVIADGRTMLGNHTREYVFSQRTDVTSSNTCIDGEGQAVLYLCLNTINENRTDSEPVQAGI